MVQSLALRRIQLLTLASACGVLLVGIGLLSLSMGTPRLSLYDLWVIAKGGGTPLSRIVVMQLRLPRFTLVILAGVMLALSGSLLQDALQNVLAGPELLGVTASATVVVAAITILHLPVVFSLIPWLALAGGLAGGSIVILTMRHMSDPTRLVLTGAALTALLNAAVILLMSLGSQNDISILYLFLVGSLANRTWEHVNVVLPWAAVSIPLALLCARLLNVLQLGDDMARGLGVPILPARLFILVLSTGLVSAVVAVCGPISFIALLAPHLTRRLLSTSDARIVLPCAALVGAVLLSGADLLARQAFDPQELPVGIWTTLLGGPFLLFLLHRARKQRGAVLFAVLWLARGPAQMAQPGLVLPLVALLGGVAAGGLVYILSWSQQSMPSRLVLTGVLVSVVLRSSTSIVLLLRQETIGSILIWLIGSFNGRVWVHWDMVWPWALVSLPIGLACASWANVLQLGDLTAVSLGMRVTWVRTAILFVAVLLTASAVAVVGGITFLGLIAPHSARRIVGSDARRLFPFSTIVGAGLLLAADTVAQAVSQPASVPVGALLALLGAPFFLYLVWRRTS